MPAFFVSGCNVVTICLQRLSGSIQQRGVKWRSSKGKITGIVFTASSLASTIVPSITGILADISLSHVILFDMGITTLGVVLALIVNIRYNIVKKYELKASKNVA